VRPATARPGSAAGTSAAGMLVKGRPTRILKPERPEALSQQDVYAFLIGRDDPRSAKARLAAAERSAVRQAEQRQLARAMDEAARSAAEHRDAQERLRFSKMFGTALF